MRKSRLLSTVIIMIGVFSAFSVWADGNSVTAYVGSAGFVNRIGTSAQYGYGFDFNAPYGTQLTNPPFTLGAGNPNIYMNGAGSLVMFYPGASDNNHTNADVGINNPMSLSNASYSVNFQNGLPSPGTGYGMGFGKYSNNGPTTTVIDSAFLSVLTFGNNQSYLFFSDEVKTGQNGESLAMIPLSLGTSSIAIGLKVDQNGIVTAGYIMNPADRFMLPTDPWVRLSASTQLDQQYVHEVVFFPFNKVPQELPSNVPIPAAVWLLGSGLLGLIGVRRKIRK